MYLFLQIYIYIYRAKDRNDPFIFVLKYNSIFKKEKLKKKNCTSNLLCGCKEVNFI